MKAHSILIFLLEVNASPSSRKTASSEVYPSIVKHLCHLMSEPKNSVEEKEKIKKKKINQSGMVFVISRNWKTRDVGLFL